MSILKYIPVTWAVLYVGLKENWLTSKEVVHLINNNLDNLNCEEGTLVDLNVNDDDKNFVSGLLEEKNSQQEQEGVSLWKLAHLLDLDNTALPLQEKLQAIALEWSRFDYPEDWRTFIHYLPSEKADTPEQVYENFLSYLEKEKVALGV